MSISGAKQGDFCTAIHMTSIHVRPHQALNVRPPVPRLYQKLVHRNGAGQRILFASSPFPQTLNASAADVCETPG